ncbi:hypothetical protein GCM10023185_25630 [Hymenobacter saemangeumensis]|uniref:Zinc/iron permease n=2 Tax=Hymenobacter saemangeumensis TaxID=1084522 RepID=A0ABP8IHW6_9BACT
MWPVLALALLHLFAGRLVFLSGTPRSIWLSLAGGVSVAYIFLHLFPELGAGQALVEAAAGAFGWLEHHVYLMALTGLVVFYGLERLVTTQRRQAKAGPEAEANPGVFWLHIGSFAIYNALIGYLLYQREEEATRQLLLFALAMALHFVVNDFGLQQHHAQAYRRRGRWVLVAALVLGWATGLVVELPEAAIALLTAFIGGGVVLNVLKEELPKERESRYWAFLLGASAYAVLLLAL